MIMSVLRSVEEQARVFVSKQGIIVSKQFCDNECVEKFRRTGRVFVSKQRICRSSSHQLYKNEDHRRLIAVPTVSERSSRYICYP